MTLPRRSLPLLALALLGLAWAEAWLEIPWVTGNVRRDPEGTAARRADRAIAAMRARFRRMAQEADRVATNLAGGAMVRTGLARPEPEGARDLFDAVIASGWEGLEGGGLEVVRADGTVVAWNGHTPVPGDALAESGVVRRRLEPGPLHLWYVVAMPVLPLAGGTVPIGSVRAGGPIESRPGLHPRFRRNATLSEAALAAGAADARVAAGRAHATAGGAWIAAPLDPDRPGLGAIEVRAPSPEHLLSEAGRAPRLRAQFLTLVLVAALGIALARALRRKLAGARAGARRALALLPWALRWAVVLLGLPASGTGGPVFDPASYSNGALGGLFATPAEFLLTAIAALASVGLLLREAPGRSPSDVPRRRLAQAAVGGAMAVAAAWICALAVESVVRDSTLEHFDPAEPLPSGAVLALHAGLWLLALSGFLLASGWIAASTGARELGAYAGGAVAGLAAALVGAPETIPAAPLAGGIALYAGGVWFCRAWTLPQRIMLSGLFAALLLHPCFDAAREEDVRRTLLQGLPDVLAPQDGYFEHEAESAAERLAADPDVRTLVSSWRAAPPDPSAAVDLWRRTVAGLGCDAAVRVLDASRAEITALAVNFPPKEDWQGELPALPEQTRTWNVRLPGEVRVDVYAAHAGVLDDSGTPAGSVVVALSPPGRSLAGTSFPEAEAPGKSLPRVRVSRFTGDGDAGLPAPAAAHFRGSTSTEPWHDRHRVGERELETLYAREPDGAGIVAMTYEPPRALERGAAFLALFLGNSAPALAAALAVFAVLAWPHRPAGEGPAAVGRKAARHLARMENQLLAFFLAVSLVPIVLLSVLSRALVRDRIESAVGEDTLRAVGVAQRFFASERTQKRDIPEGAAVPLEPFCRRFAALSGKDLSAFVPGRLGATSKPELFDLGIHPRRVPARAYRALVLDEQESRLETWSAGRLQYQVAFQALRQEGRTARVFAVPVLFNRREVDAETGRATVLVFGSYGLVLLLLWAGALGLAGRLGGRGGGGGGGGGGAAPLGGGGGRGGGDGRADRRLQPDDLRSQGGAGQPGARRARDRLARDGAADRPRDQEPADADEALGAGDRPRGAGPGPRARADRAIGGADDRAADRSARPDRHRVLDLRAPARGDARAGRPECARARRGAAVRARRFDSDPGGTRPAGAAAGGAGGRRPDAPGADEPVPQRGAGDARGGDDHAAHAAAGRGGGARAAEREGRRTGDPARGDAAHLRALLQHADGGDRPRARDLQTYRGGRGRPDRGGEPPGRGGDVHDRDGVGGVRSRRPGWCAGVGAGAAPSGVGKSVEERYLGTRLRPRSPGSIETMVAPLGRP